MLMEEPCFDILRTREQLGYHVYCAYRNTFGILGFSVTVHTQADKFSCSHVDERIEAFLQSFSETLNTLSEKEFTTQVSSLIKIKRCVDLHLKEEVDRNWGEILSSNYLFDRTQKEIACLEAITLQEVKTWFHEHILSKQDNNGFKKLGVQVVGSGKMQDSSVLQNRKRRTSQRSCSHCVDKPERFSSEGDQVVISEQGGSKEQIRCLHQLPGNDEDETIYQLQFSAPTDDHVEAPDYIHDIRQFKQDLMIFPVTKVTE